MTRKKKYYIKQLQNDIYHFASLFSDLPLALNVTHHWSTTITTSHPYLSSILLLILPTTNAIHLTSPSYHQNE